MSVESQICNNETSEGPAHLEHNVNESAELRVQSRVNRGVRSIFKLSNGEKLESRRYLPLGVNDCIVRDGERIAVYMRRDREWIDVGKAWAIDASIDMAGISLPITFKEIESEEELSSFLQLKKFHYRGGGGAGRTVPIIGVVDVPDLPRVIGFVELSSSMIANTARKNFFDAPYREPNGLGWNTWDRPTSQNLSSIICRISRFVIHPELRGLGLAAHFSDAAQEFARERWHFGGFRPRFLEITADMLRYYPFVGKNFRLMGETEGNEHRVIKDMSYLVKRALANDDKGMPQGGGGIMSLQRGYATKLMEYVSHHGASLEAAISQLRYDPSVLNQDAWESLHKINRKPKPCYIAGLSTLAHTYVESRYLAKAGRRPSRIIANVDRFWKFENLSINVKSDILQTTHGRTLQDAFGFVGGALEYPILDAINFRIKQGTITLVCGASGAGKSMFLESLELLLGSAKCNKPGLEIGGTVSEQASTKTLPNLNPEKAPLEYIGRKTLQEFLEISARCGLAEPQLFVRPIWTLSSGQRYRLQLALAFLQQPDVLIIDNFCEALDRFSARAVCRGLAALVRKQGTTVILATAAYDRLDGLIHPALKIMLRRGDKPVFQDADHEV